MKMYICITILAYFLTDFKLGSALRQGEIYLLNSLYEKMKNRVSLKQMTVKNLSLPRTKIRNKGQV